MSASSVRCAQCRSRIPSTVRLCPVCGAEQPLHVHRVRCNYCGWRVPSNALNCPHCDHNPHGFYLKPRLVIQLLVLALVVLAVYLAFSRPPWLATLAFTAAPTQTPRPPASPTLLVLTATPAEPAAAAMPTETPTLLPTTANAVAQPTSTPPPAATATATATPTNTPTAIPRKPTPMPTATSIPPTATPSLPAPVLTGPSYGHIFSGPGEAVDLTFHGSVPLAANQWFRVQIDYRDRNNVMISWCGWSRSNTIRFPRDYFDDSWQTTREFRWHVNLVETGLRAPSTCAAAVDNSSPDSPAWLFYWY